MTDGCATMGSPLAPSEQTSEPRTNPENLPTRPMRRLDLAVGRREGGGGRGARAGRSRASRGKPRGREGLMSRDESICLASRVPACANKPYPRTGPKGMAEISELSYFRVSRARSDRDSVSLAVIYTSPASRHGNAWLIRDAIAAAWRLAVGRCRESGSLIWN